METTILEKFRLKLGDDKVLTGKNVSERSHHIWKMDIPLKARAVLLPSTTQEVSEIMAICYENNQPVVVHGGLTNMVGSTETLEEDIVISMEKMTDILEVDENNKTITVEAGTILENIHRALIEKNLLFPITFGAKGSARIGGVISTNAGGLRVFKYGMTRNLIMGLEVVLPDGTIISSLKKLMKDNTGLDLKQLFIGTEGTMGIITKAVLKIIEAPKSRNSAFVGFQHYEKILAFLKFMDLGLGGNLSAFELIWKDTYFQMAAPFWGEKTPLSYGFKYYVLLEALGSQMERDRRLFQELLEEAINSGLIEDAMVAQSETENADFWKMREEVGILVSQCKFDQHFDISIPVSQIENYMDALMGEMNKVPEIEKYFIFGHMADGNIHLIIGKSQNNQALTNQINELIYAPLRAYGGSISAEHGIGTHKKPYLYLSKSPEEIALMKKIKQMLDPEGLLNKGKIFDIRE